MNLQTECDAVQLGLSFLTNQECFIGFVQFLFDSDNLDMIVI